MVLSIRGHVLFCQLTATSTDQIQRIVLQDRKNLVADTTESCISKTYWNINRSQYFILLKKQNMISLTWNNSFFVLLAGHGVTRNYFLKSQIIYIQRNAVVLKQVRISNSNLTAFEWGKWKIWEYNIFQYVSIQVTVVVLLQHNPTIWRQIPHSIPPRSACVFF